MAVIDPTQQVQQQPKLNHHSSVLPVQMSCSTGWQSLAIRMLWICRS